jgi:acetyl esterase
MPLDSRARLLIDQLSTLPTPWADGLSIDRSRREMEAAATAFAVPQSIARWEDFRLPPAVGSSVEIPIRCYWPSAAKNLPLIVFYHGGGWVLGNIITHDAYCRRLATASGAIVASVDYRLAPEHKYPAAFDDSYAAVRYLVDNATEFGADPQRIAVAGDSAGGNLAAAVALAARDAGRPTIALQVLLYPVIDYNFHTPSYLECGEGYFLTRQAMEWFWTHYLERESDGRRAFASPLRAETLEGLPPALILTAGYDPLRDEGRLYAERLGRANVQVEFTCYEDMFHGFCRRFESLPQAEAALRQVATALKQAFGI